MARPSHRRTLRPAGIVFRACVALGLALTILAANVVAQGTSTRPANQSKTDKPAVPAVVQPPVLRAHPLPAPPLAPSLPPVVEWDGKQLTIDAQDSTLSDILLAIRSRTGAAVDMPGSAAGERVAVHLGPAPIREVLASLLYGTDFDYVIQGSDTDEYGLKSVTLTARGKGDDPNSITASQDAGVRLMPGYAAPGKRTFEVMQDPPADNSASAADSSASADSPAANQESASASGDPASSTPPPPPNSDSQPSTSSTESADAGAGLAGTPSTVPNTVTSSSEASAGGASSISLMEQNLQKMYQQRQKIQSLQNQGQAPAGK